MPESSVIAFAKFLNDLEQATNESQKRHLFTVLAAVGFDGSDFAAELSLGAEYNVHFQERGLLRRGAVDSFYGNLVIEFEADLAKTGEHALDQLRGYVAGAWTEEGAADRPYLAVATDGRRWEVYSPRLADPAGTIEAENVTLELSETWTPPDQDAAPSLRDFLNRLFFRKTLLSPTTPNFVRDFGVSSPAFLASKHELSKKLTELAEDPELRVLRRQWSAALQISYGSVDTDDELFIKHTYLAVLARLLVWAALEHRSLETVDLDDVLTGIYFTGKNVSNLVEDDYFRWHRIQSPTDAARTWTALARHLAGYDLTKVREDILKPLYEQLVDPATRHELGEYYTPDWLATLMTETLLGEWDWDEGIPSVLDPTCGSGTFLRAVIQHVREKSPDLTRQDLLYAILSKVVGIDVHPLAVIVARATFLLAIQDLVRHAKRSLTLPVFLASSLNTPKLVTKASLWGERTALEIDNREYPVPLDFVHSSRDFDEAIDDIMSVARGYGESGKVDEAPESLRNKIGDRLDHYSAHEELVEVLGTMAKHIAELIRAREDSVYGFMLKNHYRPSLMRGQFDYVIGNPPWLTVGAISTQRYKDRVVELAAETKIAPRAAGEQAHTELATIFLCQAVTEFLAALEGEIGHRVALVMPRSVFNATHHRLLREGKYEPRFDVTAIWDLGGVLPLFNVPACVLFATPSPARRATGKKPGLAIYGNLGSKELPWATAEGLLTLTDVEFELAFLGKRSAWRIANGEGLATSIAETVAAARNHYVGQFRQGAILYPQNLFAIETDAPLTRAGGSVRVRTNRAAAKTAKLLKATRVNHEVDRSTLYLTAAGDHILPYTLAADPWPLVLPTLADPGTKGFGAVDPDALRRAGRVDTAAWLEWAEKKWERARKKSESRTLWERLDHIGQLSAQALMRRFVVLYTASGKRPVACVIDTEALPLPFVARDKTYWASFAKASEAHFVCAFLNSDYVSAAILDWMTKGLLGPRDIHKRALDVPLPAFDSKEASHKELANLAKAFATHAASVLGDLPDQSLGRQRAWIRRQLDEEKLAHLEELVGTVSKSVPSARTREAIGVFSS